MNSFAFLIISVATTSTYKSNPLILIKNIESSNPNDFNEIFFLTARAEYSE